MYHLFLTNLIFFCIISKIFLHMFRYMSKKILFVIGFLLIFEISWGQNVQINIDFGPRRIALNEPFTISVEVTGEKIEHIGAFPDIQGLEKMRVLSATSKATIGGKTTTTYIRTQVYHPQKEGKFELAAFSVEVNDKTVQQEGTSIRVGPYDESKGELATFDFEDLFSSEADKEFIEVQEDAFLGISIDKDEVYVGEGFNVILAFYVYVNNRAPMKFHELGRQVEELSGKISPSNCWEENFEITEVREPLRLQINGKYYDQYVFYQASFFPLNADTVFFPSLELEVQVKNKIAENEEDPNAFDEASNTIFKSFYTRPKIIRVKELPPHPLRDKVAVGTYYLRENKPNGVQKTGEDFAYSFQIIGEGNISAISNPVLLEHPEFDFYPPNSQQYIRRSTNAILGSKTFTYQVIPKEAGQYTFKDHLYWIAFNPKSQSYDTLRARAALEVSGESLKNATISSAHVSDFYKEMEKEDTQIISLLWRQRIQLTLEVLTFVLLIAVASLAYRS